MHPMPHTLLYTMTLIKYVRNVSKTHKGLSARLAAHIHNIVAVSEAVEASGRALGVSAHVLEVQPVTDIEKLGEGAGRGDDVDAVAGRAPDGVLDLGGRVVA